MTLELEQTELEETPKFRNFDWEKAKAFYYVAKFGSFANAARALNISQPALSRKIMYLEQHLECPLFQRHSGGVKLTRKGEELFSIIERTFVNLKGFTQNTYVETANRKKRKIRIATTHVLASYVFSDLILDYNHMHPHIVFELIGEDHRIDILLNDVDIAIRPYAPEAHGVIQEPLLTLEKRLYASPEYVEKYGEPQTLEDLRHHRIIAFGHPEEHPYADVNWILRLGMPERELHEPAFTSNSLECIVEAANKGMGVISSYPEMRFIKTSKLKNILPNTKDKKVIWYLIYPHYLKKDGEINKLKDYLQEKLAGER